MEHTAGGIGYGLRLADGMITGTGIICMQTAEKSPKHLSGNSYCLQSLLVVIIKCRKSHASYYIKNIELSLNTLF